MAEDLAADRPTMGGRMKARAIWRLGGLEGGDEACGQESEPEALDGHRND